MSSGMLLEVRLSGTLFLLVVTIDRRAVMVTNKPAQTSNTKEERPHRTRGWTWWLVPRPFDLMSSLLYIGVLAPYLYSVVRQSGDDWPSRWWQAALMFVMTCMLLGTDRLEYFLYGEETPQRAAIYFLVARIVFIEVLSSLDHFNYTPFLYFVVLFLAYLSFGELVGYALMVLIWLVYVVKHMYYSPGWLTNGTELHYLILFTVGITMVITIARVVSKEKASHARTEELLSALEASHQQLQEYAGQVAELATARERNRLARDIHDTLGHYLTVINVQLEKALTFRDKKPEIAIQAVSDAKRLASEALQDVRRSVGTLRSTQERPEFIPSLTRLIERVQSENCVVELYRDGDETRFSEQRLLVLYRAIQEGLTNIQRHAGASRVHIDLRFTEQAATLLLSDNGCGFELAQWQQVEPGHDGGYGLRGVQERLELVGGSFRIKSAPDQGTTLHVIIPQRSAFSA